MSEHDDKILNEFLADGYEALDHLDRDLVELEQHPTAEQALARAFRALHTIKGTCSFFGFRRLERLAHSGENLLSRARSGERVLDHDAVSALLAVVDGVRFILKSIEATHEEPEGDDTSLIGRIEALLSVAGPARPAPVVPPRVEGFKPEVPEVARTPEPVDGVSGGTGGFRPAHVEGFKPGATPGFLPDNSRPERDEGSTRDESPRSAGGPSSMDFGPGADRPKLFDSLIRAGRLTPEAVTRAETQQSLGDPRRLGEIMVENGTLSSREVFEALVQQEDAQASVERSNVRVDVLLLDRIMNLVGELVLARNQVVQFVGSQEWESLGPSTQRLNHVTTRLQEEIMRTRMQAISALWMRMPRLVRDVSSACGKQVELEMEGNDTELDKTLIEAIKDPIVHLVRNAVDHGIESPEIRRVLGKPAEGRLYLRAFHEGGQVNIEISDDGAGLPIERIRQKVVERRLATSAQAAAMSERELVRYIFLPGFSTAQRVTKISGRGVGMDVVKSSLDRIGGTIDVQTRPGEGTTFRIRIPLTLAIIPALMVGCCGERFAIPQVNLVELTPLHRGSELESVQGALVYRLRGELLPVVVLREQLGRAGEASGGGENRILVVLRTDGRQFGIVVDGVHDTEEIVVKPLADALRAMGVYAGATIRGDGRVALILDIAGLARRAGMSATDEIIEPPAPVPAADTTTRPVMVTGLDSRWRVAVPLDQIERIEEVPSHEIGGPTTASAMRWRDRVIPIVRLAECLGAAPRDWSEHESHRVLVHVGAAGPVGYAVDTVEDIVEAACPEESRQPDPRFRHTLVSGRILSLVDLDQLEATGLRPAVPPSPTTNSAEAA